MTPAIEHRIVLTGASGTLGSHVLALLVERPDVSILALLREKSQIINEHPGVRFLRVDFFDKNQLASALESFQPTCLIHCAATGMQFPRTQWFDLIRFNVDVSLQLCECVASISRCHFVYISTGLAYRDLGRLLREDDPLDTRHPYGASKAAAEILMRSAAAEFNVPLTVLRPFSFTGNGDTGTRLFPSLLRAAEAGQSFLMSPGEQIRDHSAAHDISCGIVAAALAKPPENSEAIINLGSGDTRSIRQLISDVIAELELPVQVNFGARPYPRFEPMFLAADIARARELLEWRPQFNLAYAVWELAQAAFPSLQLRQPRRLS